MTTTRNTGKLVNTGADCTPEGFREAVMGSMPVYGPVAVIRDTWTTLADLHRARVTINHREATLYRVLPRLSDTRHGGLPVDTYSAIDTVLDTLGERAMGANAWQAVDEELCSIGETFETGEDFRLWCRAFFEEALMGAINEWIGGWDVDRPQAPWFLLGPKERLSEDIAGTDRVTWGRYLGIDMANPHMY